MKNISVTAHRTVANVPGNQPIFDGLAAYENTMYGEHMKMAEKMIPMLEKFIKEDGMSRRDAFRKAFDLCDTKLSAFIIAWYVNRAWAE